MERDVGVGRKSYQLYIFGGGNGPEYFNDVYVFDVDSLTWSKPSIDPDTKPPKRRAHASCLWNDKLIVIGGGDGACALDDVYMLDISNQHDDHLKWELMPTVGNAPPARGYHTCNLVKDKLVMFGGSDGHDCFEDVHVLDLESKQWTQIDLDRKVPRLAHTSTQVGSYVFVIGGHDGRRYSQDVLLFNLGKDQKSKVIGYGFIHIFLYSDNELGSTQDLWNTT
jgi:N-acetylneuraminic acid mutarotase